MMPVRVRSEALAEEHMSAHLSTAHSPNRSARDSFQMPKAGWQDSSLSIRLSAA